METLMRDKLAEELGWLKQKGGITKKYNVEERTQEIIDFCKENNITTFSQLKKSKQCFYTYIIRHKLKDVMGLIDMEPYLVTFRKEHNDKKFVVSKYGKRKENKGGRPRN